MDSKRWKKRMLFRYERKKLLFNYSVYVMLALLVMGMLFAFSIEGYFDYDVRGNMEALYHVLDRFFLLYFLLLLLFVSPLFAGEQEREMAELLYTSYFGKREEYLRIKERVVFFYVNILFIAFLLLLLSIHFIRIGFWDADVSIQSVKKYSYSMLHMTLGELLVYKIIFGVLGGNLLCFLAVWISLHSKKTFQAFLISVCAFGIFDRRIFLSFFPVNIVDYILAFAPVNSYKFTIVAIVPDIHYVYAVGTGYIFVMIFIYRRIKKDYHLMNH